MELPKTCVIDEYDWYYICRYIDKHIYKKNNPYDHELGSGTASDPIIQSLYSSKPAPFKVSVTKHPHKLTLTPKLLAKITPILQHYAPSNAKIHPSYVEIYKHHDGKTLPLKCPYPSSSKRLFTKPTKSGWSTVASTGYKCWTMIVGLMDCAEGEAIVSVDGKPLSFSQSALRAHVLCFRTDYHYTFTPTTNGQCFLQVHWWVPISSTVALREANYLAGMCPIDTTFHTKSHPLPDELLGEIIRFLDRHDLKQVLKTSRDLFINTYHQASLIDTHVSLLDCTHAGHSISMFLLAPEPVYYGLDVDQDIYDDYLDAGFYNEFYVDF